MSQTLPKPIYVEQPGGAPLRCVLFADAVERVSAGLELPAVASMRRIAAWVAGGDVRPFRAREGCYATPVDPHRFIVREPRTWKGSAQFKPRRADYGYMNFGGMQLPIYVDPPRPPKPKPTVHSLEATMMEFVAKVEAGGSVRPCPELARLAFPVEDVDRMIVRLRPPALAVVQPPSTVESVMARHPKPVPGSGSVGVAARAAADELRKVTGCGEEAADAAVAKAWGYQPSYIKRSRRSKPKVPDSTDHMVRQLRMAG